MQATRIACLMLVLLVFTGFASGADGPVNPLAVELNDFLRHNAEIINRYGGSEGTSSFTIEAAEILSIPADNGDDVLGYHMSTASFWVKLPLTVSAKGLKYVVEKSYAFGSSVDETYPLELTVADYFKEVDIKGSATASSEGKKIVCTGGVVKPPFKIFKKCEFRSLMFGASFTLNPRQKLPKMIGQSITFYEFGRDEKLKTVVLKIKKEGRQYRPTMGGGFGSRVGTSPTPKPTISYRGSTVTMSGFTVPQTAMELERYTQFYRYASEGPTYVIAGKKLYVPYNSQYPNLIQLSAPFSVRIEHAQPLPGRREPTTILVKNMKPTESVIEAVAVTANGFSCVLGGKSTKPKCTLSHPGSKFINFLSHYAGPVPFGTQVPVCDADNPSVCGTVEYRETQGKPFVAINIGDQREVVAVETRSQQEEASPEPARTTTA